MGAIVQLAQFVKVDSETDAGQEQHDRFVKMIVEHRRTSMGIPVEIAPDILCDWRRTFLIRVDESRILGPAEF
jgi:hypothetical protein